MDLPEEITNKLDRPDPAWSLHGLSHGDYKNQMLELFSIVERTSWPNRVKAILTLFDFVNQNQWFIHKHNKLYKTVMDKLNTFKDNEEWNELDTIYYINCIQFLTPTG